MHTKPLLFLDFDGVLHPNCCSSAECFSLLPALVETITPFELDIVISSSWRHHRSRKFLRQLFPVSLRKRIIGTTGEAFLGSHARWNEICAYLRERPAPDWRALDDFDFEFPPDCPELIHCEGGTGYQGEQRTLLANWLSEWSK